MKRFIYYSLLLIYIFSHSSISFAQERSVDGIVTTLEDLRVVNAEVKVLSNKMTVWTDSMGKFRVKCLLNDKIKISAKGFNSEKIKVNEKTTELSVNLRLKPSDKNIDAAIGYGHIKERDKSFIVSTIKNDNISNFARFSNMYDLIDSISPSIMVRGTTILIRGSNSMFGSNNAIVIVDGVETPSSQLAMLSPLEVKSVDVLDGSSAAIYGARGANGVVIISTLRGGD